MQEHIRRTEWVTDSKGNGWFNGYYDNQGRALEGEKNGKVSMMLTGQVFAIMNETSTVQQTEQIINSAKTYLFDEHCGGYRLNTDFGEIRTDMGRMFGFAYGEKENGAVFSHMAVMFANALYRQGFAKEGKEALEELYRQAMDMEQSRIYPGIPEYFGKDGRGLYHYLTGAASWYMLTVVTQMFGVRGEYGDLKLKPMLGQEQFDGEGRAALSLKFRGKELEVVYENRDRLPYGKYRVCRAVLDKEELEVKEDDAVQVSAKKLDLLDVGSAHQLLVVLG